MSSENYQSLQINIVRFFFLHQQIRGYVSSAITFPKKTGRVMTSEEVMRKLSYMQKNIRIESLNKFNLNVIYFRIQIPTKLLK